MDNINKTAIAGIAFFALILAGFVGVSIDQTTVALLAGALIGLCVTVPTVALIILIGVRKPAAEPVQPPQQQLPPVTHHHHYDQRRVVVVVNVPADANEFQRRMTVASELRVAPSTAQRMIDAGEVQCLPAGR